MLSPVPAAQEIDFKNPNLNASAAIKEATPKKDNLTSPEKEAKLSSRHRLSKTSLLPSIKKTLTVADEDEYYDEEYDEEDYGEENKIDEQAVEIMSPGKKT